MGKGDREGFGGREGLVQRQGGGEQSVNEDRGRLECSSVVEYWLALQGPGS